MTTSRIFNVFLGFHTFLIGLFPFFLPVYLFKSGYDISQISWFIALTGGSYCLTLYLWDRLRHNSPFAITLILSFILENVLLLLLTINSTGKIIPFIAISYGMYNCLFWIVQRLLFLSTISLNNTGRKFGNFQIYVLIVLKIGIFIGGLFLELWGINAILIFSFFTTFIAITFFSRNREKCSFPLEVENVTPMKVNSVIRFQDSSHSFFIFSIDGIFLFLESHFWLITLFLLVHENFWQLGILVILLALGFSLLFICIKNRIDAIHNQRVFILAVGLYALSWVMRTIVSTELDTKTTVSLLILITFSTSFFRLAFNKRFFDLAQNGKGFKYILVKSYLSQFFLMIFFGLFAVSVANLGEIEEILQATYWGAALLSPFYLLYRNQKI